MLYFVTLAGVVALMARNSQVLSHFFDIIGSALGFVLDMLLIGLIPEVVFLVTKLFELGGFLAGLPDLAKVAILGLGLAFLGLMSVLSLLMGAGVVLEFVGWGEAAGVVAGYLATVTGALTLLVGAIGGFILGGIVAKFLEWLGVLKMISDWGEGFRNSDMGKMARESLPGQLLKGYAGLLKGTFGINYDLRSETERAGTGTGAGSGTNTQVINNLYVQDPKQLDDRFRELAIKYGVTGGVG